VSAGGEDDVFDRVPQLKSSSGPIKCPHRGHDTAAALVRESELQAELIGKPNQICVPGNTVMTCRLVEFPLRAKTRSAALRRVESQWRS
jgi:hypothetical protein